MKLVFLGTGSAFTVGVDNYHSNMLLESENGKCLLIDCGGDARLALYDQGHTYKDINDVYISHLHADHVGGLEWLAFTTYFDPEPHKVCMHIHHSLVDPLWQHVLSGGLCSLQGPTPTLTSFFNLDQIEDGRFFKWENIEFHLVETDHGMSGSSSMSSYGLFFKIKDERIYITTDSQFNPPQIQKYYDEATIIFQDCEITEIKSGVHAHFEQLVTLPPEIKRKMWLYHYNTNLLPDALGNGFAGFVQRGQVFHFQE